MEKKIKSYRSFLEESKLNENKAIDWIKEKFKKVSDYFGKLKGKALVSLASSIIPKELLDYVKMQAGVSLSEEVKYKGLGASSNIISQEELDSLSPEEYSNYLQELSDSIIFEVGVGGDVQENDKALYDFLISNGIEVTEEVIYKHEKSIDNIMSKIDSLNINPVAKKILKGASMVVLFGMMVYKGTGSAFAGETDSDHHAAGDKYFDDKGDDKGDGSEDKDPRSLWDKISGKKVSKHSITITPSRALAGAKSKNLKTPEEYIKYLQEVEGYKLTSVDTKTITDTLLIQKPDTITHVSNLAFGIDGDLFLTGKYELNPNVKSIILNKIDSLRLNGGIITNYVIESSTDKEPIKMGNDVLAQKRADAVKEELVSMGVDNSLIKTVAKPEQGPNVFFKDMTKAEKDSARMQTQEFRYVTVNIIYYDESIDIIPKIEEITTKVRNIYELEREYIAKTPPPPKGFPSASSDFDFKIQESDKNLTKCENHDNRPLIKKLFSHPFWKESDIMR